MAEKNKVNGKLGGRPKKTQSVISGIPNKPTGNPNQELLTINQDKDIVCNVVANVPHQAVVKLYEENLPMLAKVKFWTDKRKALLKARWNEDKKRQDLIWWDNFFKYIAQSDFLTGRAGKWQADIEWILNSSNIVKIIEGKYENKEAA
jgi:hypothetical protein